MIKSIYRTGPKTFIVTRQVRAYQKHANNILLMTYETSGKLTVSKRQHLRINGSGTGQPCWTLTFSGGLDPKGDADRFLASLNRAQQIEDRLQENPMAWLTDPIP
jgi:hypothetical protein